MTLAGPHAARPLRRQRAPDGHRARAARARRRVGVRGRRWARRPTSSALAALGASAEAGPGDVVIAVDGEDGLGDTVAGRGRSGCWPAARRRRDAGPARRARCAAAPRLDGAPTSRSISVPGEYATLEAHRALTRGLHVFLFSDHVSRRGRGRAQAPRRRARAAGHGARVRHRDARPASASASPTSCARARWGSSPRRARARRRSPACSTPPAAACRTSSASAGATCRPRSAARWCARASRCWRATSRPRRCCSCPRRPRRSMRWPAPSPTACEPSRRSWAGRATSTAGRCTRRSRPPRSPPPAPRVHPTTTAARCRRARAAVLGLFSGGSLAHEAVRRARPAARAVATEPEADRGRRPRRPRPRDRALHAGAPAPDGRPRHPAASCSRRRPATGVGCVLLDVVCGHGAHADPASELAGAVARAARQRRGRRARVRDRRRPAGRRAPGRGAARRRRGRRAVQRRRRAAAPAQGDRVRIAMLTYSVRPRGGVVHALAVAGALAGRGHEVELFAIGPPGTGFFRTPAVPAHVVAHVAPDAPFDERICALIDAYTEGLREPLRDGGYDVVHAQDCISANAALDAARRGRHRRACVRTVHHVDDFRSPSLIACQERSIVAPDRVLVRVDAVDRAAARRVRRRGRARAQRRRRRALPPAARRRRARRRARGGRPRRRAGHPHRRRHRAAQGLADAAARLRRRPPGRCPSAAPSCSWPAARRSSTTATRSTASTRSRDDLDLGDSVRVLGPVDRRASSSGLYRAADVFALPSTKEGFGLAVLEALAAGAARRRLRPRRLPDLPRRRRQRAAWRRSATTPRWPTRSCARPPRPTLAARLRDGGRAVAARHGWDARRGRPRGGLRALPGRWRAR